MPLDSFALTGCDGGQLSSTGPTPAAMGAADGALPAGPELGRDAPPGARPAPGRRVGAGVGMSAPGAMAVNGVGMDARRSMTTRATIQPSPANTANLKRPLTSRIRNAP